MEWFHWVGYWVSKKKIIAGYKMEEHIVNMVKLLKELDSDLELVKRGVCLDCGYNKVLIGSYELCMSDTMLRECADTGLICCYCGEDLVVDSNIVEGGLIRCACCLTMQKYVIINAVQGFKKEDEIILVCKFSTTFPVIAG